MPARRPSRRSSRRTRSTNNKGGNFGVKNHVTSHGKEIVKSMKHFFGVDISDFNSASKGDIKVLEEIGEKNNNATVQRALIPQLEQAFTNIIDTTGEYNSTLTRILASTAKNKAGILNDQRKVELIQTQYTNRENESQTAHNYAIETEDLRHLHFQKMHQLKATVDRYVFQINSQYDIDSIDAGLGARQISEDKRYQIQAGKNALNFGSENEQYLTPQKQYVQANDRKRSSGWLGQALNAAKQTLGLED